MALSHELCLDSYAADTLSAIFKDITVYGTGGNLNRHEIARKYLVAKTNIQGIDTFLELEIEPEAINNSGEADIADYIADKIKVPTAIDGWYRIYGFDLAIWNNATAYTKETSGGNDASIVFYEPTLSFYLAKENNTNVAPNSAGGLTDWELITDFSFLLTRNDLVSFLWNDIVTSKIEKAYIIEATGNGNKAICQDCISFKEIERFDKLFLWLNAMYAGNTSEQQSKSEKVARFIENQL